MNRFLPAWLLLLLPAPLWGQAALPVQERGGLRAWLEARVVETTGTPGLAEVVCTITVEGEPGLEVEPARVEDALAAWQASSARLCPPESEGRAVVEVVHLKQVKPGAQQLPALRVRLRAGPERPWEEVEWTDLLRPRHVLPPEVEPEPESPAIPAWTWPVLAGGGIVLVVAALVGVRVLARPRPIPPPTPEQWAVRELDALEGQAGQQGSEWYHTRLSYIVRRFLEEKYGLKAPRQTTAEFLASAELATKLSDPQRELLHQLLERCDLAKFAPVSVSSEDCRQAAGLARTLVGPDDPGPGDVQREPGQRRV